MSVQRLDLRGADHDAALRAVRALVGPGTPPLAAPRLLVLDDAAALAGRHQVYDEILTSNRVGTLVCVAVGALPRSATGHVLRRPGQLRGGASSVTVWVGDTTGVDWAARSLDHPVRPQAEDGLARLVEVLSQPPVFDRVVALGPELPNAAASPGLHWAGAQAGVDAALAAVVRGVADLTGAPPAHRDPPVVPASSGGPLLVFLDGDIPAAPVDTATSLLAGERQEFADAAAHAEDATATARSWRGLVEPTARPSAITRLLLPRVREALSRYAERVEELFSRWDRLDPGGPGLRTELANAGVRTAPPSDEDVKQVVTALSDRVEAAVEQGGLRRAAADLGEVANQLHPMGGTAVRPGVGDALPDDLLAAPPLFAPVQPYSPLLLAAFVAPLLPALLPGPVGTVAAVLVAVAWLLVVLRLLRLSGARVLGYVTVTVTHAAVAAAGVAVGSAVAGTDPLLALTPTLQHPLILAAAVLASAAVAAGTVLGYWRSRVRQWAASLGLERARQVEETMTARLREIVWSEYVLASGRVRARDAAAAASGAIHAVQDALTAATRDLDGDARGAAAMSHLVDKDLCDLVRAALGPAWRALRAGAVREADRAAHAETERLMAGYLHHLQTEGIAAPPSFSTSTADRRTVGTGEDHAEMLAAVRHPPAGQMLQLCDPADVRLLSAEADPHAVRFARKNQRRNGGDDPESTEPRRAVPVDTVWTDGGRLAGVLRLVPLRPNVVEDTWEPVAEPWEVER